ncbi:hypothetical protein D3C71_2076420 [compost metagenome]
MNGWLFWVAANASAVPAIFAMTSSGNPSLASARSMAAVPCSTVTPSAMSKEMPSDANWPSWLTRSSSRLFS